MMTTMTEIELKPHLGTETQKKMAQQKNREIKRREVLDQAAKTLNRRGVSQASLASIAESLGTTRAALYYYVDNQEDLVYQCYVRTCGQLTGLLDAATATHEGALDIIIEFMTCALDENRAEFASLSDVAFLKDDKRSTVLGLYKGVRATLSNIIALGIERGELRACNPLIAASIIIGLITWAPIVRMWRLTDGGQEKSTKNILDVVIRGIAAQRVHFEPCSKYDLSAFGAIPGNVFDAKYRAAARKETLLISASWLFNQKGVDATPLEEVALRVGVTKKVISHNVGSKDALVAECYQRGFRFFNFVADATRDFNGSRILALRNSIATLAQASVREDIAPFAPITGLDALKDEIKNEIWESASNLVAGYVKIFHLGIKEGSIRELETQEIMTPFPAGFYSWMPRWIATIRESERDQIPDEIADFLCLGLSPIK